MNSGQIHHHMGGFCGWIVSLEKVPDWVHSILQQRSEAVALLKQDCCRVERVLKSMLEDSSAWGYLSLQQRKHC